MYIFYSAVQVLSGLLWLDCCWIWTSCPQDHTAKHRGENTMTSLWYPVYIQQSGWILFKQIAFVLLPRQARTAQDELLAVRVRGSGRPLPLSAQRLNARQSSSRSAVARTQRRLSAGPPWRQAWPLWTGLRLHPPLGTAIRPRDQTRQLHSGGCM